MKIKNALLGLAMLAAMLIPSVSTTSAHVHNEAIMIHDLTPVNEANNMDGLLRAPACACGSFMSPTSSYTSWANDHQKECTHYPWGYDMVQSRYYTKGWKCSRCGRSYNETPKIEFRTLCNGHY